MHHEKVFVKCNIGIEHSTRAYVSVAPTPVSRCTWYGLHAIAVSAGIRLAFTYAWHISSVYVVCTCDRTHAVFFFFMTCSQ